MDFGLCQKIAKYIMRPPRTTYQIQDLGPRTFQHHSHVYERIDFSIQNDRKLKLQCSLIRQKYNLKANERQTIIFLHANSSSRLAVKNYLGDLLPFFNVACLDCAGSGNSQGSFVTLGYNEKEDLRSLIRFLKSQFRLAKFILWGRSMGAVTALLYAGKYQDVDAVVSDNAFSDLEEACIQLKDSFMSILPDFLLKSLLQSTQQYMDENMNKVQKLNFKLNELKPKQVVSKIKCPIFYIYSQNDKIVNNRHSKKLYDLSNYPKRIMSVKGDHNGQRDNDIKGRVIDYLLDLILKNRKQSPLLHKMSDISTRQEEEQIVYQSPLNYNLQKSYLGNTIENNRTSMNFQQQQFFERTFSLKLDRKSNSPVSNTFIDYDRYDSSKILKSQIKQEEYHVEANQFQKGKSLYCDSCQPARRRRKIFYKN